MSRQQILLVGLALAVAGCSGSAESTTTAPVIASTTTTAAVGTTTTAPVTDGSQSSTTTEAPTTTTTPGPVVTAVEIALVGGTVTSVERFDVPLNGAVRLTVSADVSDEVHLHGYDLHADVAPGQDGVIEFDATIPGVFEIELEGSGVLIGELQVAP